eukprot:CAMPEP_0198656308 /NCGR_PEP_ID=MMETSP1467-20131203/8896_1 /TAXON_ID=1462469 /ORGANISM="unid. sp., Strain CCMP2135" /LENGTH=157 /DNA_ID=CAMNT_0044392327 /DNA_START=100 /DNA_END=573 /DNA_ORIENTATION=+
MTTSHRKKTTLVVMTALATTAALQSSSLLTSRTALRGGKLFSVAPPVEASELIEKARHCVDEGCDLEDVVALRTDLEDTLHEYDVSISNYADLDADDEDVGTTACGAHVEDHALRKYIAKLRNLHTAMSAKLEDLDSLIAALTSGSSSKKNPVSSSS